MRPRFRRNPEMWNPPGQSTPPAPIEFTDDFARADGAVGNNWTGGTWAIASGIVANAPTLGDELITDGGVENWNSSTDLVSWAENLLGTSTVNQDGTDKHGGSYSVRIDADGTGNPASVTQVLSSAPDNAFIHLGVWSKTISTRKVRMFIESLTALFDFNPAPGTEWSNPISTHRVSAANKNLLLTRNNQVSQSLWFDDVSAKPITDTTLDLVRPEYPTADYVLSVKITTCVAGTLAGIRFALDDPSNPQNYLLAVSDGAKYRLYKCLNGVLSSLQKIGTPANGDVLTVVKSETSVRVFQNDVPLFATQTVNDATIKDNLYAGIFSTYSGNQFDDWSEAVKASGGSNAFLDPYFTDKFIFPIGDSVTEGSSDEVSGTGYPALLCASLHAQTGMYWAEKPARYAGGGYTVHDVKLGIDAALAARTDTPDYIPILLGTNDVVSMPDEATWKSDFNYILDALHAKWANAEIYLGSSYRSGELTDLTTLKSWMADLIAARSSYCFAGIDTYPLYNGHPELLADGLHPNHAGYVVMVVPQKTVLGY